MKLLIRNPAPDDPKIQQHWGDYHYGFSLARALKNLGCDVEIQFWPNWVESEADVLITLRGLRESSEIKGDFNKKIVWLISHPKDVPDVELRLFDIILAGSPTHSQELAQRDFKTAVFLQCTDDSIFFPQYKKRSTLKNAFVFVGNYRDSRRDLVDRAISADLPLKIWGSYWPEEGRQSCVVKHYFPNERLGELYRNSYCTLNDHWDDMISYKYVNNRVFDALACGLPILSEPNPGMDLLNLKGIKAVHSEETFDDAVDDFIVNYDHFQEAAYNDASIIREKHTFKARAQQLLSLLS